MLPPRLRFFLAIAALWASMFGLGLALDDKTTDPWVLSAPTLLRLGALSLPVAEPEDALRALSALLLHSDALHLCGNLAALALIVATWPLSRMRVLALLLPVSGSLAALGSMATYATGLSVGPSGALCAAVTFALCQPAGWPQRITWLLLAGAFLIGGALSNGDQGAHVAGLLAGLGLGSLWRVAPRIGQRLAARRTPARL